MRFLLRQEGVIDLVGNADAAVLGEGFGVLLAQERAPYPDGRSAAEGSVALHAGEHLAEHGVEKLRLEIDRGGVRLGLEVGGGPGSGGGGGIARDAAGERSGGRRRQGRGGEKGVRRPPSHHLDIGLDGAGGLDRLQDGDEIARTDAERIEPVDQLLQRHAFLDHGEPLAVLGDADARARRHHGLAAARTAAPG